MSKILPEKYRHPYAFNPKYKKSIINNSKDKYTISQYDLDF